MTMVVPDSLETLNMVEENGVVRSMTRRFIIADLPAGALVDYNILIEAYQKLNLPLPGQGDTTPGTFFYQGSFTNSVATRGLLPLAMLVLAKRKFDLGPDKNTVYCTLEYQHFMDGDNQNLSIGSFSPNGWFVPSRYLVYGKNRASVQQSKSNYYDSYVQISPFDNQGAYAVGDVTEYKGLFWICLIAQSPVMFPPSPVPFPPGPVWTPIGRIWGLVTEPQLIASFLLPAGPPAGVSLVPNPPGFIRRQIVVGHQFPTTGERDHPGEVVYQTGEISVMQPNDNLKLHGRIFVKNPRNIKKKILRAINSAPWMDGGAYTWMCTEVTWEPLYINSQWRMGFEFQHNEDTWLPTAIFNDARIGRPPPGLVDGFGFRSIHKHPEIDFEAYFQQTFGCAPNAGA